MEIQFFGEGRTSGPVDELLEKMRSQNRRAAAVPQIHPDGSRTYEIIALAKPLPLRLYDFIGSCPDPSKVMGIINYHGLVAENVTTTTHPDFFQFYYDNCVAWTAWKKALAGEVSRKDVTEALSSQVTGVLRAASLTALGMAAENENSAEAFASYAEASITASFPEAHLGLARCAEKRNDNKEIMRQIDVAWRLAGTAMDVLPWTILGRYVWSAIRAAEAALRLQDTNQAREYITHALKFAPTDTRLLGYLNEIAEEKSDNSIFFDGSVPVEFRENLEGHGNYDVIVSCSYRSSNTAILRFDAEPSLASLDIQGLFRARRLITLSAFQFQRFSRAYPFLPSNFIVQLPVGYTPRSFSGRPADICVLNPNEVTNEIVRRVQAKCGSVTVSSNLPALVYLDCPLVPPTFSSEILEAQHAGAVPVVAGVGCLPELVYGGYFYKPPVTSEAFIDAASNRVAHLLSNADERKQIAEDGKRVVVKHSWENVRQVWHRALCSD